MIVRVTDDEAAPMITSAFCDSSRSTVWDAMFVEVSPESPGMLVTGWPSTPPASLMSLMASATPANSGGPRKASEPVCGSTLPTISGPLLTGMVLLAEAEVPAPPELLPPHAASARLAAPSTAADRHTVDRFIQNLLQRDTSGGPWDQVSPL